MAEEGQNNTSTKNSGSVPPFAIVAIVLIIIAGLGISIFAFFKDKVKSAFSKPDDSNTERQEAISKKSELQEVQSSITDNLNDSAVNDLENTESKGIIQNDTAEPIKEENSLTLPEETTDKIVRPENEF